MNYFMTQRITTITIFLLILLNLSTLSMLWIFRFKQPHTPPRQERRQLEGFLQEELGLTEKQARQFDEFRKQHFKKSKVLVDAIQHLKRDLIEDVFISSPDREKIQAIADEIGEKQAELETLRYRHFLKLKSICQPEQLKKFQALFHEIFPPQPNGPPQLRGALPGGQSQNRGRPPGQFPPPPQEAVRACQDKHPGDSCRFRHPHGTAAGFCRNFGKELVCNPDGIPPGNQFPKQHHPPI